MSAEEIVFHDPNLLGLVLGWLNQDKHIALYICLMVNHLFYEIIKDVIKPRYNPLGAWLRYFYYDYGIVRVPPKAPIDKVIRLLAKNHISLDWSTHLTSNEKTNKLMMYYGYYGYVDGIKDLLITLSEKEIKREMTGEIPNKYLTIGSSSKAFSGIFSTIAHSGNYECFEEVWYWYLNSSYCPLDENIDDVDLTTVFSMGISEIYNYGRIDMIDEVLQYDYKATDIVEQFEFEYIFADYSENYERRWDTAEQREARVFEMLRTYVLGDDDTDIENRSSGVGGLMSYCLHGFVTYTQFRTLALKAWEWGARISYENYFKVLSDEWSETLVYPEEKIIDDIKFAVSLIQQQCVPIPRESVVALMAQAEKSSRFKLASYLCGLLR